MLFEIRSPNRIVFGPGTIRRLPEEAAPYGRRPLLVSGRDPDRYLPYFESLRKAGHRLSLFKADPEPTIELILKGVHQARLEACDFVVGCGGGSVIDTGKAISALLSNPENPFQYLEVIGEGKPLPYQAAPYIAIPTTAGTGAEVTSNSVLISPEHRVKVSLRSPKMLPRVALVDPELTHSLPPAITASTGLDALTQVLEAYVSRKASPFTDGLCLQGVQRAARSLRRAYHRGNDKAAREDMALTSLFSGLALANAGLGAVHGLAGPLGGLTGAPHGEICAALIPFVTRVNIRELRRLNGTSEVLQRYQKLASLLTGNASAEVEETSTWLLELSEELKIRSLSELGLKKKDLTLAVEMAQKASSMKGNPVALTSGDLTEIVEEAF